MAAVPICLLNTDNYQFARRHFPDLYKTLPQSHHISPDTQWYNNKMVKWTIITYIHIVQSIITGIIKTETRGNKSMGMLSQQCCWRSDALSLLVISAFQRITMPSKHYEIHSDTASQCHTPEKLGLKQSTNFLELNITCMWLLHSQKQVFQYHYAWILGGQNHSGNGVKKEGTVHASLPISMSASLLTHLTLLLSAITYQISTYFNTNFYGTKCQNTRFLVSMLIKS
jgi:hypothetical protein